MASTTTSTGIAYNKRRFEQINFEDGGTGYREEIWIKRGKGERPSFSPRYVDDDEVRNRIPTLLELAKAECTRSMRSCQRYRGGFNEVAFGHRNKILDKEERGHFVRHVSAMYKASRGERPGDIFLQWRMYRGIMPGFIQDVEELMKQQPPAIEGIGERGGRDKYPVYSATYPE
jgi:hypothetical protein